jgi:hypothetical protein
MIILLFFLFLSTPPAKAQLAAPMTGHYAPLIYYRVGFVSKHKHLTEKEAVQLIASLKDEPIIEKYILRPKQNPDGSYEIEMLMRIIFFEKHEAELALQYLQDNPQFCTTSYDTEIVECRE